MIRKIFIKLLLKHSKTRIDRIFIQKILFQQILNEFTEDNKITCFSTAIGETLISNEIFLKATSIEKLEYLKRIIDNEFDYQVERIHKK